MLPYKINNDIFTQLEHIYVFNCVVNLIYELLIANDQNFLKYL